MPSSDRETYKNNPTLNNKVKRRDLGVCIFCGSDKNIQTHHFIPRIYLETIGLEDREDFMVTVCQACHKKRDLETKHYFAPYVTYLKMIKNQMTIWDLLEDV